VIAAYLGVDDEAEINIPEVKGDIAALSGHGGKETGDV
jgi:hypothetical protein